MDSNRKMETMIGGEQMKKVTENIKMIRYLIATIVVVLTTLFGAFKIYTETVNHLESMNKTVLRLSIWSEEMPMHDRLESCDTYLSLGYNSETKKYCEILITRYGSEVNKK